jgi:hypothetical protein
MHNHTSHHDHAGQAQHPQHDGDVDYERQIDYDLNRHSPPREQLQHIPGWGADLDRKDRPAVPMERTPPRFIHVPEGQPVQQARTVEVFCSPERPGITPLFGTAQPPRGLSGAIRRLAYKLTENDLRHWLMLLAADRVDMVEGVVDDLRHGHLPNVLGEMGIRSELRYNPAGLVRKTLITTAVVGGIVVLLKRRSRLRA